MIWSGAYNLKCLVCEELLTIQQYRRKSQRCDDCEFDSLIYPGWFREFLDKLKAWEINKAS